MGGRRMEGAGTKRGRGGRRMVRAGRRMARAGRRRTNLGRISSRRGWRRYLRRTGRKLRRCITSSESMVASSVKLGGFLF